jgi:two-component sensor histidine kinase
MPRFEARLLGLSASHDLLVETGWESADLADIARVELTPILGEQGSRWQAMGVPLRLKAEPTVAIGMAFHELATNAVKYGALSNDTGRVILEWRDSEGAIEVVWREVGGPAVTAPTRKGFGSRLIPRDVDGLRGDGRGLPDRLQGRRAGMMRAAVMLRLPLR